MSYTNQTANYGLPQYSADDKPTYLGDFNKAMLDIDTAIKNNENIAQASQTLAQNANNSASEALSTANTASSSATNAGVKADNAYALAESAKADATQATTDATDAKTIANSANQTATSANATATSASTTATNANNTAISAQTTANTNSSILSDILPHIDEEFLLFDNDTNTNNSITLNDSVANYDYIEIIYKGTTGTFSSSGKIYHANGKDISLVDIILEKNNATHYCAVYNVSTNTISTVRQTHYNVHSTNTIADYGSGTTDYFDIIITQVIGYKKYNTNAN